MTKPKEDFASLAMLEIGERISESYCEYELSLSISLLYADSTDIFWVLRPCNQRLAILKTSIPLWDY
ncbi:hypothetical protein [Undibacterium terreum]|uniref:Uncharacterized protein n=1 Tax=Undibacterium terreum TaxID=1224302 RepID=A0A916XQX3_9BURK|nr:hypothetical protein [Undibacterium terreum]GGD00341.1 hypothetical protein GCM10011396_54830 [Undibacterium terreum]